MDAWPLEITAMCLPLAAGRDVGSTGRLVPLLSLGHGGDGGVETRARARPRARGPRLEPELGPDAEEDLLLELHAAAVVAAMMSTIAARRCTLRVRVERIICFPPLCRYYRTSMVRVRELPVVDRGLARRSVQPSPDRNLARCPRLGGEVLT